MIVAVLADAVGGVLNQVDQHLLDLLRVNLNAARRRIPRRRAGCWPFRSWGLRSVWTWRKGSSAETVARSRLGGPGEEQDIFDDAFEPADFVGDDLGVGVFRGAGRQMLLLEEEPGLDGGERVADFVGDAGGQHAEGSELFLALQQRLAFHQLDPQRRDQLAIDHHGQSPARQQQQDQRSEQNPAQVREGLL